MAVAPHVEQRIVNDDRAEEIRSLREGNTHEKPPVAGARDSQTRRRGHALPDELLGNGDEVVVDALPVFLESGAVPLRAELSPASNVRQHVDTTALEPQRALGAGIGRG